MYRLDEKLPRIRAGNDIRADFIIAGAPAEAMKPYHASLARSGITPLRDLAADSEIAEKVLREA